MAHVSDTEPLAMPVMLGDLEISTVLDTGFFDQFKLTANLHSHAYFELFAAISGDFRVAMMDGSIDMHAGQLCIIPPGLYHASCAISDAPVKLAVRFDYRGIRQQGGSKLYEVCKRALAELSAPRLIEAGEECCRIMWRLHEELTRERIGSEELTQALMAELYISLLRLISGQSATEDKGSRPDGDGRNKRYYLIECFFDQRYMQPITEDDLAGVMSLSRRQTGRVLRDIYGMSFREKLTETRLHNAARLLTETSMPIEKIAEQVGYESTSGLYMAFRKRFGTSLRDWRESHGGIQS